MVQKIKVFACGIEHESHSFSKRLTELSDFLDAEVGCIDSNPGLLSTRSTAGGILSAARERNWDLRFPFLAHATPSGPLTRDTFETLLQRLVDQLIAAGPVDGVLLALHGAMFAEHCPDCEGEILRRVREVVGAELPIAITLDLHANFSDQMAALANIATSFRTTPHTDQWEASHRAACLLDDAIRQGRQPQIHVARLPMMAGMDMGRTMDPDGPMSRLQQMARTLEAAHPEILDIALNAGFYYGDIAEAGPSVTVTAVRRDAAFAAVADQLMRKAWESRDYVSLQHYPVAQAVELACAVPAGPGPVILADYTDGPAGGAYADGTHLLRALLDRNLPDTVVGPIFDPEAVQLAIAAGSGAEVTLEIGGKTDPGLSGGPVRVSGKVTCISDGRYVRQGPFSTGTVGQFGPSVLIQVGQVGVIVVSRRQQPEDREQYRIFGIDPERLNILACKGINHFRADFEPISRQIIFVDSGGLVSVDFKRFPFRNVRRPIWPLDEGVTLDQA